MMIWCDRNIVRSPIYFGLCTSAEMFHKELKKLKIPKNDWPPFISNDWSDATCHHLHGSEGSKVAIVCIREMKNHSGIGIAALLVHEAVHIWQAIKDSIGENNPSSEFEAYSIQKISLGLMDQYSQQVTPC